MKSFVLAAAMAALAVNASAITLTFSNNCTGPSTGSTQAGVTYQNFGPFGAPTAGGTALQYSASSFNNGSDPGCGGSYLTIGGAGNVATTTITFGGNTASYFGFQWGTPDSYNTLTVNYTLNGVAQAPISYLGFYSGTGTFNPGYTAAAGYANITTGVNEAITSVTMASSALAFETDNHSFVLNGVPEPSTYISVLTAGGALLALRRRSRKA